MTSDLLITSPFHLEIYVLEAEDHLPSFKSAVKVNIDLYNNSLNYEGEMWFECNHWDEFLYNLYCKEDAGHLDARFNDIVSTPFFGQIQFY